MQRSGSRWYVGDRPFDNKILALKYAESKRLPVEYYFYDREFDAKDWTQEPSEDWALLLRTRALQLRGKYDYLRLWYSGGADSHTVLTAFLNNEIHIDEITLYRASPIGDFEDFGNSEINSVALPFLHSIKSRLEKTKVTLIDIGPVEYRRFYGSCDWITRVNAFEFRPVSLAHLYLFYPQLNLSGRTFCDIQGGDKPRLKKKDGKFYSYFWDTQRGYHTGSPCLEDFFLSPDMPDLHIKQSHLVRRTIIETFGLHAEVEPLFRVDSPTFDSLFSTCRFPLWKPHSLGKSPDIFSAKCRSALRQALLSDQSLYDTYFSQLQNQQSENVSWFNDSDIRRGLVGQPTREYALE